MSTRIFAFIIGIDSYKSGSIWNLHSCVDDAKNVRRWLVDQLNVPRDQIRILLDSEATQIGIESSFMEHLINNAAIERGDAIFIYFAGHGSSMIAPRDWFSGISASKTVEVLCPYDHDTKQTHGRVAGISDRSMQAMLYELWKTKGDNITFVADCCFSPSQSRANLERSHTRWTPTSKATPDDLYRGLWPSARARPQLSHLGFFNQRPATHTFLAACSPGFKAVEGKDGGKFTSSFLRTATELTLHRITYSHLMEHVARQMGDSQRPACLGQNRDQIVFDGIPFIPDSRFLPVSRDKDQRLRVEAGAIQGVVEGSELSLHIHNFRCSRNPSIGSVVATDVHATWCLARTTFPELTVPRKCWAQVIRWNNRRPFRVNFKTTITSFFRNWRLRRHIPNKVGAPSKTGLNILRVKHWQQADISLTVGRRSVTVQRHDDVIASNSRRLVKIEKRDGLEIVEDAARFNLHLYRRNPENPLRNLVHMELFSLDPLTWSKFGGNLLKDGKAVIAYDRSAIFSIILSNKSKFDLWPYLAYMDPNCYGITMLYQPDISLKTSPLPKDGKLEIGTGKPGSEALSFALSDYDHYDSGFLKLFLSPTPVSMSMIEQGPSVTWSSSSDMNNPSFESTNPVWDTDMACITFLRPSE